MKMRSLSERGVEVDNSVSCSEFSIGGGGGGGYLGRVIVFLGG